MNEKKSTRRQKQKVGRYENLKLRRKIVDFVRKNNLNGGTNLSSLPIFLLKKWAVAALFVGKVE